MENCGRFVFYNNIYFFCEKPKTEQAALRDILRHFHGLYSYIALNQSVREDSLCYCKRRTGKVYLDIQPVLL